MPLFQIGQSIRLLVSIGINDSKATKVERLPIVADSVGVRVRWVSNIDYPTVECDSHQAAVLSGAGNVDLDVAVSFRNIEDVIG